MISYSAAKQIREIENAYGTPPSERKKQNKHLLHLDHLFFFIFFLLLFISFYAPLILAFSFETSSPRVFWQMKNIVILRSNVKQ